MGLEIRQNTAVAPGQVRQGLASLNQEFLALLSQESQAAVFHRAWVADEALDPVESLRRASS